MTTSTKYKPKHEYETMAALRLFIGEKIRLEVENLIYVREKLGVQRLDGRHRK